MRGQAALKQVAAVLTTRPGRALDRASRRHGPSRRPNTNSSRPIVCDPAAGVRAGRARAKRRRRRSHGLGQWAGDSRIQAPVGRSPTEAFGEQRVNRRGSRRRGQGALTKSHCGCEVLDDMDEEEAKLLET